MDDAVGIMLLSSVVEDEQPRGILIEKRDPLTEITDTLFRRMFRLNKELVRFAIGRH